MEETLAVPLAVEPMILRHVVRIRIILAFSPIQTSMAAYSGILIKDLNKTLRTADIDFLSDICIRNRVILIIKGNMIIQLNRCLFLRKCTVVPEERIPLFRSKYTVRPEQDTACIILASASLLA